MKRGTVFFDVFHNMMLNCEMWSVPHANMMLSCEMWSAPHANEGQETSNALGNRCRQ